MIQGLVDTGWVAVYELGEAVRTRLFQLVLVAYLGGVGLTNWILVKFLAEAEAGLAQTMGVPATERPGAMIAQLTQNGELLDFLGPVVGGRAAARMLLDEPVLGLWAGVVAMGLLPLIVAFTASGSIATEVKSRSIRYLACRTGRLEIGLGKLLGQLFLAGVAAGLGIVLTVGMGETMMVGVPVAPLLTTLVERVGRACIYALPFAGLGLAVSSFVPNPNGARVVTGGIVVGMYVGTAWLERRVDDSVLGRVADLVRLFCANTTWGDFWTVDDAVLGAAIGRCLILALLYYAVGHVRFGTRDV